MRGAGSARLGGLHRAVLAGLVLCSMSWGAVAQVDPAQIEPAKIDPAQRAHQEGLYLQMTRGELPGALDAFVRALEVAEPERTDELLLGQARCLEWSGDGVRQRGVLSILRARGTGPEGAGIMPAESDLLMQLKLTGKGSSGPLERLDLQVHPDIEERFLAGMGAKQRISLSLSRVTAAVSLGEDERSPVDHWVARLDGEFSSFKPALLKRLVREVAVELARVQPGIEVNVDSKPGGPLVVGLGPACCPGPAPSASMDVLKMHGQQVTLARVARSEPGRQAVEVGVALLGDGVLLIGGRRALERTLAAEARVTVGMRANQRLWSLVERIPADTNLWMILSPDEIVQQVRKVQAVLGWGGGLPEVTGLMLTGKWDQAVEMSAVAWTTNAEAAGELADLARAGLALLRLTAAADTPHRPVIEAIVDGMRIDVQDREVLVQASVPQAALQARSPDHGLRQLSLDAGERVRLALDGVLGVKVSHPEIVRVHIDGGGLLIVAEEPGQAILRIERSDRPAQELQVRVTPNPEAPTPQKTPTSLGGIGAR